MLLNTAITLILVLTIIVVLCLHLYSKHYGVHQFREAHAFIGFQKDTPAAVVFQATNQLKTLLRNGSESTTSFISQQLLKDISTENLILEGRRYSDAWKDAVNLLIGS